MHIVKNTILMISVGWNDLMSDNDSKAAYLGFGKLFQTIHIYSTLLCGDQVTILFEHFRPALFKKCTQGMTSLSNFWLILIKCLTVVKHEADVGGKVFMCSTSVEKRKWKQQIMIGGEKLNDYLIKIQDLKYAIALHWVQWRNCCLYG